MRNEVVTAEMLYAEASRLSKLLDKGLATLYEKATEFADADRDYTEAWAIAYTRSEGTQKERAATADLETIKLRHARTIAESLERAARKAIESRQSQLSALQSVAAASRAQSNLGR